MKFILAAALVILLVAAIGYQLDEAADEWKREYDEKD